MAKDDTTKRDIVMTMIKAGKCSPSEAAEVANVSRQLVNYWMAGFKWRPVRKAFLERVYEWAQKTI